MISDDTKKLAKIDCLNIKIEITKYQILPNYDTLRQGYDSIKSIGYLERLNKEIN